MDTTHSVGIWGLGKVGKAYLTFLSQRGYKHIGILDKRALTDSETTLLETLDATFYHEPQERDLFLKNHDFILPSPGVDVRPYYEKYQTKFLNELDLFYTWWPQPIIAITGSVGKTTVTHLIGECLRYHNKKIAIGGNIGTPTAELLLESQQYPDGAVLEVSSFQLEHTHLFAPDLALWTTFVPNHLDRHTTEHDYFMAKYNLLRHQSETLPAIVPLEVAQIIRTSLNNHRPLHIVTTDDGAINFPLEANDTLWYLHNKKIMRRAPRQTVETILELATIPPLTFNQNIVMVAAALSLSGLTSTQIEIALSHCSLPAHRLEYVSSINGVQFYNDSKATTTTSTLAAVQQLQASPLVLLLGGLSKGVNRLPLITALQNHVKCIVCFGAEREELLSWCIELGITAQAAATLDEAFAAAMLSAVPGDTVLLSPSGSSYDLYTDYQARGDHFKQMVARYKLTVD